MLVIWLALNISGFPSNYFGNVYESLISLQTNVAIKIWPLTGH